MRVLAVADLRALLEDGPHTLDELAAWLDVPPTRLAPQLGLMGIPACERCHRYFLRRPLTTGRFCDRACYETPVRPSDGRLSRSTRQTDHQPVVGQTSRSRSSGDDCEPADGDDDLEEALEEVENTLEVNPLPARQRIRVSPALRQAPERPSHASLPIDREPSWWVGKTREELRAAAAQQQERMRGSKAAKRLHTDTLNE